MTIIGLTGGVGMGKSTTANFLAERGWPVIDTDIIARELVEPDQPALGEIAAGFGQEVLDASGQLRRGELARIIFSSVQARQRLEAILHPRIRHAWLERAGRLKVEGATGCVVVIPLLFETAAQSEFTATICTACSGSAQRERLRERGWSPDHVQQRIDAQWPIDRKMLLSTYVIWTEGPLNIHGEQVDRILLKAGL